MINGKVRYVGNNESYQVFYGDRGRDVRFNEYSEFPIQKCFELVTSTEWFCADYETALEFNNITKYNLKDKYKDKRIFIIGGGWSLKDFDFSRLDNDLTITVNHASRYYPKSKMMIFIDKRFLDEATDYINNYDGILFYSYRTGYNQSKARAKEVYCFPVNRLAPQEEIYMGLYNGELTGLCAINLALIMGCNPIYLLGFDLNPDYPRYFFQDEFKKFGYPKPVYCDKKRKYFQKYAPYRGRVHNCSIISTIDVFDYRDIDEVLNDK